MCDDSGKGSLSFLRSEDFQTEDHSLGAGGQSLTDDLAINETSQFSIKSSSQPGDSGLFNKALDGLSWDVNQPMDEQSHDEG